MSIFNSLGSNYNLRLAWSALTTANRTDAADTLRTYLATTYHGEATLFYKGREALEFAFGLLSLSAGSAVVINGYTCLAVYQAVRNVGCVPQLLDIAPGTLHFSTEQLRAALANNPSIKAVVIQNTLGYPVDIEGIANVCKEKNIILIEDLAHSAGTLYANGQMAGTMGDMTIFSFGQDKIVDVVSGGALVVRNPAYQERILPPFTRVGLAQQWRDRCYPILTWLIRKSYGGGVGKVIHAIFRKLKVLPAPMTTQPAGCFRHLPAWQCRLAYEQLQNLDTHVQHRCRIAQVYAATLKQYIVSPAIAAGIEESTNLRFPIFVEGRDRLLSVLKEHQVYVSDIWYDAPIAPEKYQALVHYKDDGVYPEAEKISRLMLNLPTHQEVTVTKAAEIAAIINTWLP